MTPNPTGNLPTPTIVGLGRMGANMARRLARAGLTVHGFDPSAEAREAFAAAAELDPSNVDALREVKRWEKRTSGTHQAVQPKKRWFGLVS